MNRLSEYISGMTLTRQHLREAKARIENKNQAGALASLVSAFDAFVSATNCAISIREKKKPKAKPAREHVFPKILLLLLVLPMIGCNSVRRLTGQDEHHENTPQAARLIELVGTWNGYYKTDKIGPVGMTMWINRMAEGDTTFSGQWNDGAVHGGIDGDGISNFTGTVNSPAKTFTMRVVSADSTCGGTFDIGGTLTLNGPSVEAINFTSITGSNCLGAHTTIEGAFQ